MPLPKYKELCSPIIKILQANGGRLSVKDLESAVADMLGLTTAERSEMHSVEKTKLGDKVAWARYYLKKQGILSSEKRGVSILSKKGMTHTKSI